MALAKWLVAWAIFVSPRAMCGNENVDCAPQSLAVALSSLKVNYNYSELKSRFGKASDQGYSLAKTSDVAESYGLYVQTLNCSLESLRKRKGLERFACICWVDKGHFVVCTDYADGSVTYIDPPDLQTVPAATFAAKWKGEALLISHDKMLPESGLASTYGFVVAAISATAIAAAIGLFWLQRKNSNSIGIALLLAYSSMGISQEASQPILSEATSVVGAAMPTEPSGKNFELRLSSRNLDRKLDLGTSLLGSDATMRLRLINDSNEDVILNEVRLSCSCVAVDAPTKKIDAGQSVDLILRLSTKAGGDQTAVITLHFQDRPLIQVPIFWVVTHALITVPSRLDLGQVSTLGKHNLSFKVKRVNARGEFEDAKGLVVSPSLDLISCTVTDSNVQAELVDCGRHESETAYLYIRDEEMKSDQVVAFAVSWRRPRADFISLPREFGVAMKNNTATTRIVIYDRKQDLKRIQAVVGNVTVEKWEEQKQGEDRTAITLHFDPSDTQLRKQRIKVTVRFEDGRTLDLFGKTGIEALR